MITKAKPKTDNANFYRKCLNLKRYFNEGSLSRSPCAIGPMAVKDKNKMKKISQNFFDRMRNKTNKLIILLNLFLKKLCIILPKHFFFKFYRIRKFKKLSFINFNYLKFTTLFQSFITPCYMY
jgi:hypothetical protein